VGGWPASISSPLAASLRRLLLLVRRQVNVPFGHLSVVRKGRYVWNGPGWAGVQRRGVQLLLAVAGRRWLGRQELEVVVRSLTENGEKVLDGLLITDQHHPAILVEFHVRGVEVPLLRS
jgi:hypothetical protein